MHCSICYASFLDSFHSGLVLCSFVLLCICYASLLGYFTQDLYHVLLSYSWLISPKTRTMFSCHTLFYRIMQTGSVVLSFSFYYASLVLCFLVMFACIMFSCIMFSCHVLFSRIMQTESVMLSFSNYYAFFSVYHKSVV